jgi:hypothetical protein
MKFIELVALFVVLVVASVQSQQISRCPDMCGDDFDEVVCASNGYDSLNFMGRCRLRQFNKCFNESETRFLCFFKFQHLIVSKLSDFVEIDQWMCRQNR